MASDLRTCENGHTYYKSSKCPVCPVCEKEKQAEAPFMSLLSAPARRALENEGINSLEKLSRYTENSILALHGMGPASIPKLRKALAKAGLVLKK